MVGETLHGKLAKPGNNPGSNHGDDAMDVPIGG